MKFECSKRGTRDAYPESKAMCGHTEEDICKARRQASGETNPAYNSILDLQGNTFLLCKPPCLWYFVRAALQTNTDGNVYRLLAETNRHTNKWQKKQCFLIIQLIKFDKSQGTGLLQGSWHCSTIQNPSFERTLKGINVIRAREAKTRSNPNQQHHNINQKSLETIKRKQLLLEKFHLYWNFWLHLRAKHNFLKKHIKKSLLLERKWLKWDVQQKLIWGILKHY